MKEGHIFHASPNGLNFSHQKLSSLRISVYDSVLSFLHSPFMDSFPNIKKSAFSGCIYDCFGSYRAMVCPFLGGIPLKKRGTILS